jgi:hypothetical protein
LYSRGGGQPENGGYRVAPSLKGFSGPMSLVLRFANTETYSQAGHGYNLLTQH